MVKFVKALFVLFFFFSSHIFAQNYFNFYFEKFRNKNFSKGELCEKIAFYEIQSQYPNCKIYTNLKYFDDINMQEGEADLLVYDPERDQVLFIGEVKCRNDHNKARSQSDKQLRRISDFLKSKRKYHGWDAEIIFGEYKFKSNHFRNPFFSGIFPKGMLGGIQLSLSARQIQRLALRLSRVRGR